VLSKPFIFLQIQMHFLQLLFFHAITNAPGVYPRDLALPVLGIQPQLVSTFSVSPFRNSYWNSFLVHSGIMSLQSMRLARIPLFPLNVVLLPGANLPLHIFEPRYREMVKNCLEENSPFGMLLALPDGVAGIGCTAEILEVARRYSDGRMDIQTIGRSPFRVVELFKQKELLEGNVEFLEDGETSPDPGLQRKLLELYEACYALVFEDYPRLPKDDHAMEISYRVADSLPLDLLWKQQVLELRSEIDRQERLLAYLREWAPHLQKSKAKSQRAGGNGYGLN
jgi:ATP-dependent Lon protease